MLTALEQEILDVLPGREKSGLEIAKLIQNRRHDKREVWIGSLYPVLRSLEDQGLITSRWEEGNTEAEAKRGGARRRLYKITEDGLRSKQNLEVSDTNLGWQAT